jgi:hypothetical protein
MNIVIGLFLLFLAVVILPQTAQRIKEKRLREQRLKELEQLWQRPEEFPDRIIYKGLFEGDPPLKRKYDPDPHEQVQSPMDDWEYKGD